MAGGLSVRVVLEDEEARDGADEAAEAEVEDKDD